MTDKDRTGMIQVELSDEERNERAMRAAAEQVELDGIIEKKRSHNREWNEQIHQREALISQLCTEADDGKAWVPAQADMFPANDGDEDGVVADEPEPTPPRGRRGRRPRAAAAAANDEHAA